MAIITPTQEQIIKRCQKSVTWFLRNFGKLKHPSAGIIDFYPFSYQKNAIKQFRSNRLNIFRKCFAEGSMVWTPQGPKAIETLKLGDQVYSYDEEMSQIVVDQVEDAWCNGEKETLEVRTKTGHRSYCTEDHRFHTDSGWVEAGDLTSNDVLTEIFDNPRYKRANESEAVLLGYLLTDGCYSNSGNGNQFHFTNTTWKHLLEYQKHFELFFNKRLKIKIHNRAGENKSKKNSYRVLSSHAPAKEWLIQHNIWGHKAECKQIPQEVFSWDNESIAILLNRMLAGDGWYSGSHCDEVGIGSESELMLHQIKQLLSRFQISSKFYPASGTNLSKLRIFGGEDFRNFVNKIGIYGKERRCLPKTRGFFFNRKKGQIKSVKPSKKSKVYDLTIKKNSNFIVDGSVAHNCRQAGVSKISGAFATWFAMFHSHKTILIVSRTNEDAMSFLRDHIVFLYEHLPDWMKEVWKPVKMNEHEIIFPNGSRIKSLTSHPDVLRSNASSLNIIDESAFIQGMDVMWAGGWPCSRANTLIQTSEGLIEVGDLAAGGDPWLDHDIEVATDDGFKKSDKAYCSGLTPTKTINTYLGIELEGTHHHRVRSIDDNGDYVWARLDELRPEDLIVSVPGQYQGIRQTFDGFELNEKFAEILGLYIGDGSLSIKRPKRFKIVFDYQDKSTRSRMVDQFNNLDLGLLTQAYEEDEYDTANLRLNSAEFVQFMVKHGLNSKTKPQDAQIPKPVLKSDESVVCAFLRGLFDSDGWCYQSSTSLKLGLSSTSERLIEQTQVLLHAIGIMSRRHLVVPSDSPDTNDMRYSDEPYWRLDVWDCKSKLLFKKKIGFLSDRKQQILDAFESEKGAAEIDHPLLVGEFAQAVIDKMVPGTFRECEDNRKWNLYRIRRLGRVRLDLVSELSAEFDLRDKLSEYVKRGFAFDTITNIKNGECETFDISVPENNTYLANGIVNHNTLQHGGNVICISTCVAPDTLVMTEEGLQEIQDLAPDEYNGFDEGYYHSDYNGPDIAGINGLEKATKFYKRPSEATKIITTSCGYELEASLLHKLQVVDSSTGEIIKKFVRDLEIDDYLPVKAGQMVFGNDDVLNYEDRNKSYGEDNLDAPVFSVEKIDQDLAYLLGVIIAEGHVREYQETSASVTIACGDDEVLDRCESWSDLAWNRGREGQDYVTICYTPMFVRFLKYLGVECTTAPFKTIPKRLLRCSEPIIREFLKGLFDGDGSADIKNGRVCYCSTSYKLIKQVRMLLFNYGIHTYLETKPPGETSFLRESGETTTHKTVESYKLVVSSNFVEKFYSLIGFGLERKQAMLDYKTSTWSELMPPVVKTLLKELKDTTDLSIAKMAKLGLAPNVLYGNRSRITKNRLQSFINKIDYPENNAFVKLQNLLEYDWFNCVTKFEDSENEVYDFTLPETHTFIGDCFVNENTNGLGNWYWSTWTDAEAGVNGWNPITINWWDMDWVIEYRDPLSKEMKRIAPRDGIRECTTTDEKEKFGSYWSPWLQEQYNALQEQGSDWKFKQEILADFIGSGNTVLQPSVLNHISTTLQNPAKIVRGYQAYVHPVTGSIEDLNFSFKEENEGLWIWEEPVVATPTKYQNNTIVKQGAAAHSYVMGVDIATGKGKDYSAIEIFDVDTMEQVAEFMARCLPREFVKFIDRIGRWYNCALAVVERNNGGDILIDLLRSDMMYPRLWRRTSINDKPRAPGANSKARAIQADPYGFATTMASKPKLNKFLLDFIRDKDGDGYKIYSKRLHKQFQTYVRKRDRMGRDTNKTEAEEGAGNYDDLVIACGLALIGTSDASVIDAANLIPHAGNQDFTSQTGPVILGDAARSQAQENFVQKAGPSLLMPMALAPDEVPELSAQRQLDAFTIQLGGIPISQDSTPTVVPPKFYYERRNKL